MNLFAVWTPGSILSALVGGALLGYLLVARFDNPRFSATQSVVVVAIIGVFAGTVFYASQIIETYLGDGERLAWRVISRFGLFLLFIAMTALGTGLALRRSRGSW